MCPHRVKMLGCALVVLLCGADPAAAAWNNVFQVTCFRPFERLRAATSAFFAPRVVVAQSAPACCPTPCDPCPQTQCTTRYVQRCYYQPVTTYQQRTYYQQVTTYRTSYYYEPVTTYRYTCQYDPCTCTYRRVAIPCTSYRLRSKCCPVQQWVQRCCLVPVTSYRRCCYWQPVTNCCTVDPCTGAVVPGGGQTAQPPQVQENRVPQQSPNNQGQKYDRYYSPPSDGSGSKQDSQNNGRTGSYQRSEPPQVRLERIVSASPSRQNGNPWRVVPLSQPTEVRGQIVRQNAQPGPSRTTLLFVNIDRKYSAQSVRPDGSGQFNVQLAAGRWEVYEQRSDGSRHYHSRIDVRDSSTPFITLVSR